MTDFLPVPGLRPEPWAIVLAGGDGRRLRPLTRLLCGDERPKQFARLVGGRSLLQVTLDRTADLIPVERTVVVVGEAHRGIAHEQLRAFRGLDVVVQPKNLGTGPGILLPLARIRARSPGAPVVIFPSDHHVARPGPLLSGLHDELEGVERRGGLTLVGAEAERPEVEYGWIVPRRHAPEACDTRRPVHRFFEKPPERLAACLLRHGALWNTFITLGRATELWETTRRAMPRAVRLFDRYVAHVGGPAESRVLAETYALLDAGDFSRDVLSRACELHVLPVRGCGWSDWGSPRRVFESLRGRPEHDQLAARVASALRLRGGAPAFPEMVPGGSRS